MLKKQTSQKNLYTRSKELERFFKWAKKDKRVFGNPLILIDVKHYAEMTKPLTIGEQESLVKRWLNPEGDPREAAVGLLALIYACSPHEIANIKITDIDDNKISFPNRDWPIHLDKQIQDVLLRYCDWRNELIRGAKCDYLFVSRESYKVNQPVDHRIFNQTLKLSETTVNQLRITQLIEIASTGNIKALEALGLSYEGTRRYIQYAIPVLFDLGNISTTTKKE